MISMITKWTRACTILLHVWNFQTADTASKCWAQIPLDVSTSSRNLWERKGQILLPSTCSKECGPGVRPGVHIGLGVQFTQWDLQAPLYCALKWRGQGEPTAAWSPPYMQYYSAISIIITTCRSFLASRCPEPYSETHPGIITQWAHSSQLEKNESLRKDSF
jgi:hypothetical protein